MRNSFLLILLFGILLIACTPDTPPTPNNPIDKGIPTTATNLGNLNSPYDDYNSALPMTGGGTFPIVFSSNRNSAGKQFDFVYKWMDAKTVITTGLFAVAESNYAVKSLEAFTANASTDIALSLINSDADELGPNLINIGYLPKKYQAGNIINFALYAFLYATNLNGNLDIRYVENAGSGDYGSPKSLAFLNSAKDDAYPCITKDSSSIYFCSNRDGNFDIFKADLPLNGGRFLTALKDSTSQRVVTKDSELSSPYDDKCPFIYGNMMVFTSNRPGGFGGYDLYYSKFVNGKWGTPVNFGDKINTPSDEYRPIIMDIRMSSNFMLFSSNRPGGQGGFDLYYVGVER